MSAQLDVLTTGYATDRVAGTVVAVRDGDFVAVIDPGMVADRRLILDPLSGLGLSAEAVTDVVFSHHHPDHTLNAALFPNASFHDFQATYRDDIWQDREWTGDVCRLSPSVRLLLTPGHTAEDVSTLVDTPVGLIVCTHLWWTAEGPADDPFAPDREALRASREKVLALRPALIVPGHGAPFTPSADTPA
jgi:glyoxylase-like metal-dependent hydrolase (beta-lactamase superfamily II)